MATTEQQEDFLDAITTDPDMAPEDVHRWAIIAARDYLRRAEAAEQELAQLKDDLGSERYHFNGKEASPIVLRALMRCREQRDAYLRRAEAAEARLAAVSEARAALESLRFAPPEMHDYWLARIDAALATADAPAREEGVSDDFHV